MINIPVSLHPVRIKITMNRIKQNYSNVSIVEED
jgi:hypothetical protein